MRILLGPFVTFGWVYLVVQTSGILSTLITWVGGIILICWFVAEWFCSPIDMS